MPNDTAASATSPWQMPFADHKSVAIRAWREASDDNVGLIASGVAFYGFLAIVPLLGAIVLSYGLFADPPTVADNLRQLTTVMPADAASIVGDQLRNVVETSGSKKGFGLLLALGLALFGARNAAGAIITALNIAYEEEEKRGFVMLTLTALAMTVAAVVVAIMAVFAMTMLGTLDGLLAGAPAWLPALGKIASYVLLTLAGAAAAAALYRFGPSRDAPRGAWLTPGAVFTALGWLILTLGFGFYVASFGNYNATYGSLGAIVVLLTWMYLSAYVLLLGAELNSEYEHQTCADTTTGPAEPTGMRGAWAADHVAGRDAPENSASAEASVRSSDGGSSVIGNYVAARSANRVAGLAGAPKVAMIGSALATLGLGWLRRPERRMLGIALVASTVALSLIATERVVDQSR